MLKPLNDRVLVKMTEAEEKQKVELFYQVEVKRSHKLQR